MEIAVEIADLLSEISKRDQKSLAIVLSELASEERLTLLLSLEKLERSVSEKTKKLKKEEKEIKKKDEERRFIQRLQAKIEANSREDVVIRTRFDGLELLLRPIEDGDELSDSEIATRFNNLVRLVDDLDIIKCLANFAQGRLITYLQQKRGLTLVCIARKLEIGTKYTERLANFAKFASRYPALLCSSYSMETILKFKPAIELHCKDNANFASLLEIDQQPTFDGVSGGQSAASTSSRGAAAASSSRQSEVSEMEEDDLLADGSLFRNGLRF